MRLVVGPLIAFVGVTFGIQPAVNLVARLRSPHSYSQYEFAGTWMPGLITAGAVFGIGLTMSRASQRRLKIPVRIEALLDRSGCGAEHDQTGRP